MEEQSTVAKCSKRGRKRKNKDICNYSKDNNVPTKMSLEEIEGKINDIKTKANLWLNGSEYLPSRDEAFLMLEGTQQLINTLETCHRKSEIKNRLLETSKKLATAIDIAILESDQLMYSEMSEIETCINDDKTEENIQVVEEKSSNLKSILKNSNTEESSESIKKHIHFSEEVEEIFISKESYGQNSCISDDIITEDQPESTQENLTFSENEESANDEMEYDSDLTQLSSDTDNTQCDVIYKGQVQDGYRSHSLATEDSIPLCKQTSTGEQGILGSKNATFEKESANTHKTLRHSTSSTKLLGRPNIPNSNKAYELGKHETIKTEIKLSGSVLGNNLEENCYFDKDTELSESILCPNSRPKFTQNCVINTYFSETKTATKPEINNFGESKTGTKPKINTFCESETGTKPKFNTLGEIKTGTDSEINNFGESKTGIKPEINTFNESKTGTKPKINTFSESKTGTKPKTNNFGESETGTKPKVNNFGESKTGTKPKFNTLGESETGTKPEIKTFNENKTVIIPENIESTDSRMKDEALLNNNSDICTGQSVAEEPELWTKISMMNIKDVRVKHPSEFIPLDSLPKHMLESMDWFFDSKGN